MNEISAKDYQRGEVLKFVEQWIKKGFQQKEDMDLLNKFGAFIAQREFNNKWEKWENGKNKISTSQIRIAYGELTRIKMKNPLSIHDLLMLRAKLAYSTARNQNKATYKELQNLISDGINIVANAKETNLQQKYFKNLTNLFEAVIAYHKANGGD